MGGRGQAAILNSELRIGLTENIFGPVLCLYEGNRRERELKNNVR